MTTPYYNLIEGIGEVELPKFTVVKVRLNDTKNGIAES